MEKINWIFKKYGDTLYVVAKLGEITASTISSYINNVHKTELYPLQIGNDYKRNIIGEPHDFFICGKDTDDNKVLFEKAKQIVEKCMSEIISQ